MAKPRCLNLPTLPAPELPFGLTFAPPDTSASISFNIALCCKIPPVSLPIPPIPIDPQFLTGAVGTALKEAVAKINDYINSLPLSCPLE